MFHCSQVFSRVSELNQEPTDVYHLCVLAKQIKYCLVHLVLCFLDKSSGIHFGIASGALCNLWQLIFFFYLFFVFHLPLLPSAGSRVLRRRFNRAVSQIDFGRFSSFVKPRSKASSSLEAVTRR